MKKLVIFGAGGLARETAIIVNHINKLRKTYDLLGFIVDEEYFSPGKVINGVPVIGTREWIIEKKEDVVCTVAIGYPKERRGVQEELTKQGVRFETLIHPGAWIDDTTKIGIGCIIQSQVCVSCNCVIGDGVLLNGGIGVGHDVVISDYVSIFPGTRISGGCRIGIAASIGTLSFLNERIKIGDSAVVTPGSIVFTNVKDGMYVMGNPAKKIEI